MLTFFGLETSQSFGFMLHRISQISLEKKKRGRLVYLFLGVKSTSTLIFKVVASPALPTATFQSLTLTSIFFSSATNFLVAAIISSLSTKSKPH
jgi:hypothetical protein